MPLHVPAAPSTAPVPAPVAPSGPSDAAARAPRRRRPAAGRLAAVAVLGSALALVPTTADAHVRVIPESTTAGGWTALTFRVPNESATATTQQVTVDLPVDTPLLHVSTKPVAGWTAVVETATLPAPVDNHGTTITEAPARITWTASPGAEIGDGQFQEFEVVAGPLPDAGVALVLPAHQAYSDGSVVDWDEVAEGDEEPEHPAPTFTTTVAPDAEEPAAADDASAAPVAAPADPATGSGAAAEPDTLARALGGAGLLLGLAALVVAVVTSVRRRTTA